MLLLILSGCALKAGKSQRGVIDVLYTSTNNALSYYLLTIEESFELGLGKNDSTIDGGNKALLSLLRLKKRQYADGYNKRRLKGDYVLLLDCKTFYSRREIQYSSNIIENLACMEVIDK
jgi:hypothetical protein